jgi:ribulose-phosphate 3-epimerase
MAHKILITPSILSADFARLQEEVDSVASADWIQADVMDGHFVPNLSFGAPILKSLNLPLPLDVHLMVSNPEDRIAEFLELGAKHITFHAETVDSTEARRLLVDAIRAGGATAGIAINPETTLQDIHDVISHVDMVLVMSVQPGFGGQKFLPEVLEKVSILRDAHPHLMIQMDGGIDEKTAMQCILAGATNLVAGSYVFKATDRAKAISTLRGV